MTDHEERVVDQFTRQADVFASSPAMAEEESVALLVRLSGARQHDTSLDVACGPGILVCAFAAIVQSARGIDLTPAMIGHARSLQEEKRLSNVAWDIGNVEQLPYAEGEFSIVTSRYSFHHLVKPRRVLEEMRRVSSEGGTVVVADMMASPDPAKAAALNEMEKIRDPSHVRAMPLAELQRLFEECGLPPLTTEFYRVELELEMLLQGSFPDEGGEERVRKMFRDSLAGDSLGLGTRSEDGRILLSYPIAVVVSRKGARSPSPPISR